MRIVLFCHSLASCWNHGNAHFLRGVARELTALRPRGPGFRARRRLEPAPTSSRDHGEASLAGWQPAYPGLTQHASCRHARPGPGARRRRPRARPRVERARPRRRHRPRPPPGRPASPSSSTTRTTAPSASPRPSRRFDLAGYDGVLAFGAILRELYLDGAAGRQRVWVWHEAADTAPVPAASPRPCPRATWSGSATGATASARPSCTSSSSSRCASSPSGPRVHGVRYPEGALGQLWPMPASPIAAGCPTTVCPRSSPATA